MNWNEDAKLWEVTENPASNEQVFYPIDEDGVERRWRWGINTARSDCHLLKVEYNESTPIIYYRYRRPEGVQPTTNWIDSKYSATEHGTGLLKNYFTEYQPFSYPKSLFAVEDCIFIAGADKSDATILDYFAGSGTTGHATISLNRKDGGSRRYILAEMGEYFNIVTRPRIQKVIYSSEWKDGKPVKNDGLSHIFKYIRLETYEDALNNLHFKPDENREKALAKNDDFRREYMLKYWLEFETKNSPSLLNITQFANPMEYKLSVKKPSSDEYIEKNVDLIETFNWLIGLWVDHIDIPRTFDANFKREIDPELPKDQETRLLVDGRIREVENGKYWFRKIEGKICRTPGDKKPQNMDRVLVIWRKLTEDIEEDNAVLDAWFRKQDFKVKDSDFDVIYVNGSHNLENIRRGDEHWKVNLIEEAFHNKMWDVEN